MFVDKIDSSTPAPGTVTAPSRLAPHTVLMAVATSVHTQLALQAALTSLLTVAPAVLPVSAKTVPVALVTINLQS